MTRGPPRSPLFPYPPLFRSHQPQQAPGDQQERPILRQQVEHRSRSEEHTSELQSLRHLVCRLLLENILRGPPVVRLWLLARWGPSIGTVKTSGAAIIFSADKRLFLNTREPPELQIPPPSRPFPS